MKTSRPLRHGLLLCLATCAALTSLPALALPSSPTLVGWGGADGKFPMPAADYRKRSDERLEKARVKMEEFIADKQMPKDKADAIRAEFTSGVTQIRAKIEQACADGTVTQDEADAVRSLSRSLLKHATGH